MTPTTLQDRVIAYKCFELPSQPMYTHTGTSRLISDLFIAVEALTKERDALTLGIDQWRVDYHELRLERDTLAAAAKLALDLINDLEPLYWDTNKDKRRHTDAVAALREALK